jgi:hypothetical protein
VTVCLLPQAVYLRLLAVVAGLLGFAVLVLTLLYTSVLVALLSSHSASLTPCRPQVDRILLYTSVLVALLSSRSASSTPSFETFGSSHLSVLFRTLSTTFLS